MKYSFRHFITHSALGLMLATSSLSGQEAAAKADEPPSLDELLPLPVEDATTEAPAAAQQGVLAPAAQPRVQLSESFAINLVNRLVERGVLTQADAADMIALAKADAVAAGQAVARDAGPPAEARLPAGELPVAGVGVAALHAAAAAVQLPLQAPDLAAQLLQLRIPAIKEHGFNFESLCCLKLLTLWGKW